jgi:Uma2 family endonuclease
MSTAVLEEPISIPAWVVDLDSFRRWARSDEFPENGRISYLNGGILVDMSKEQVYSHVRVKTQYVMVLGNLVETDQLGQFFGDGLRLSNVAADISNVADATFVSLETLRKGRVRPVKGSKSGYIEFEGTPDMLLEVVSDSSVQKDTVILRELYWRAGVREYWLVDVRSEQVQFTILRHTPNGYVPVRKQAGWQKSAVFGKSFKLMVQPDPLGYPDYKLLVR